MKRGLGAVLVLASCGRIGFDLTAPAGATDSTPTTDGVLATSCGGLAPTCGASGAASCCDSALVPGGMYLRSYDLGADGLYPDMANPATVSDFRLDLYEITVERFRQFVAAGEGTQTKPPAAGAGAHPNNTATGWDPAWNASLVADTTALVAAVKCDATFATWTDAPGPHEHRPINCITWYEAQAFCAWDGGYLPTEAEWNYAATGGAEQRAYPWSDPPSSLVLDDTRASYYVDATKQCFGDGVNGCTVADLAFVGTRPAGVGKWGQADLAGNVLEWSYDCQTLYQNPCVDCTGAPCSTIRVIRGGMFDGNSSYLRSGYRNMFGPTMRAFDVGARCARP